MTLNRGLFTLWVSHDGLVFCLHAGRFRRFRTVGNYPTAGFRLMILAHNLNTAMKRLVLGKAWLTKRMKALRFWLIGLPGRVVSHARKLIICLGPGAEALGLIVS